MSTITVSLTGSAITGLTGTVSKAYTISDTDLQTLLTWFATTLPSGQTNQQILLAWIQALLVTPTIAQIQGWRTENPVIPSPISIA